jgi:hypothetical protein
MLVTFDIKTAAECGWDRLRNGKLLTVAEENGFQVLLTGDKTIPKENEIAGRKIGLVALSDNHWNIIRDYVPAISEALHKVKPGQVLPVFCGQFSRRKGQKPEI